jgi:hypothetical protein
MALVKIDGGWFDPESHGYYGIDGKWVVSATQLLKLTGYSDYSHIDPEVLRNKAEIGSEAHEIAAMIDRYGLDIDPTWITERSKPYVDAYIKFRNDKNFVPDPEWIEKPIIACIHGMKIGITLDVFGKLDGYDAILERKCVETPMAAWAIQTCLQEMGKYKSNSVGRAQRFALQMKKDGTYRMNPHTNHTLDQSRAIGALVTVYGRLDCGQKLWEQV